MSGVAADVRPWDEECQEHWEGKALRINNNRIELDFSYETIKIGTAALSWLSGNLF